ncbi:MAG: LCP family protein [Mycobacteriaceae bacterium]|nr:LCP family protein [Mycobacteriaceae bacterium]
MRSARRRLRPPADTSSTASYSAANVTLAPRRRTFAGLGRAGIAIVSALALALTGTGWWATRNLVGGITVSQALGLDAPRSTDGSMNILLIGLDSRKDQHGNDLPQEILDELHAGGSDDGGYNTNTLILAHVSADNRVVAFSIPRDDYVRADGITGYDHIKIKQAYGLAKQQAEQKLNDEGVTDQDSLESAGREAGRAATLRAVRNLTGVPIDYFAEINLAGFYDVAQALGGVEVCLNNAVYDDYSGADFPAGRQRLDAAQALAFVRQRHGLDNGDLDRTHRQQAFLVSVMRQLADSGTFTDMDKLEKLIQVARKDIVLSQGWGEDQFRRVGAIANSSNVSYRTLPVLRYDTVDDQDVNIVDPAAIKAQVTAAFGQDGSPAAGDPVVTPRATVDVVNASDAEGLAARVSAALTGRGYPGGDVRNASGTEPTATAIGYGPDAQSAAGLVGQALGISAPASPDPSLAPNRVRVTLGPDYVPPAALDGSHETTPNTAAPASSASDGSTDAAPDAGAPVGGSSIPCVD